MRYLKSCVIALVLPILLLVLTVSAAAQIGPADPDRIIVRFSSQLAEEAVDSVFAENGLAGESVLRDSLTFLVRLPITWTVEQAIAALSQVPVFDYVGPNFHCFVVESQQMSQGFLDSDSDPYGEDTSPEDFYDQYAVHTAEMPDGHAFASGAGTTIAEIDNGVDFGHPLLSPRLLATGYDFLDDDADPSHEPGDYEAHGTFVAGLIRLSAPDAEILPLRALNGDGIGSVFSAAHAIEYAILMDVDVVLLGFGIPIDDPILHQAIDQAHESGHVLVAPAGNDGRGDHLQYPAAYANVMGVGAVDSADQKAEYSNWGTTVDLCAPGTGMYSAFPGGDTWGRWDGTSFAAPLVAGLAACVRELRPSLANDFCSYLLQKGCVSLDEVNPLYAGQLGSGRIDFVQSVVLADSAALVWGWVKDSGATPVANTVVQFRDGANVITEWESLTDSAGYFVTAVRPGHYDVTFIPDSTYGLASRTLTAVTVTTDTTVSVVLNTESNSGPCQDVCDLNDDGVADVLDVVTLVNHVFRGGQEPIGASECPGLAGDTNCDGILNVIDVVSVVDYVFRSGTAPTPCG